MATESVHKYQGCLMAVLDAVLVCICVTRTEAFLCYQEDGKCLQYAEPVTV